jgi:hypothetical protein
MNFKVKIRENSSTRQKIQMKIPDSGLISTKIVMPQIVCITTIIQNKMVNNILNIFIERGK